MIENYTYKLRPGYGSNTLLIEFFKTGETKKFLNELLKILVVNKFKYKTSLDLWMNDETHIILESDNGDIIVTIDVWDFIFILADDNQKDILKIDKILSNLDNFEKLKADFSEYKLKNENIDN